VVVVYVGLAKKHFPKKNAHSLKRTKLG